MLTDILGVNPKAAFSIATTARFRGGHYLFSLDCSTQPRPVPSNTEEAFSPIF